ncbi:membrane protein insertase YidC [Clostridium thailandense]|uniref:Membrane protein insertase YidC n=1 Tax=Clostridium thailandense TaxID=2794346 RepID=A0A949TRR1_9CLOT|nr:membrane protein insertase YidC [Clostridium thailandense]MBV7275342.1 membrane protein insertase YidC [Clostridium thailandense]
MNIISNILNTTLNYFFNMTGDWGIAIVLLTIIVRTVLLPMSMKQKFSIYQQQNLAKKIDGLKKKYKNNKEKLETEMKKHYSQSAKSMLGYLVSLLQIPIIFTLYGIFLTMPVQASTVIVPWVANIKLTDTHLIIPIIYAFCTLSPNLLSYLSFFKLSSYADTPKSTLLVIGLVSIFISTRLPIAVGIYLIATSIFSLIEELVFRLYMKNKSLVY